jgi:hypothetical protein
MLKVSAHTLPMLQGTPHYQSPDIAGLTGRPRRPLKTSIDSQWKICSAYCFSATVLPHQHIKQHGGTSEEKRKRRVLRGLKGQQDRGGTWALGLLMQPALAGQAPSAACCGCLPLTLLGVETVGNSSYWCQVQTWAFWGGRETPGLRSDLFKGSFTDCDCPSLQMTTWEREEPRNRDRA